MSNARGGLEEDDKGAVRWVDWSEIEGSEAEK